MEVRLRGRAPVNRRKVRVSVPAHGEAAVRVLVHQKTIKVEKI